VNKSTIKHETHCRRQCVFFCGSNAAAEGAAPEAPRSAFSAGGRKCGGPRCGPLMAVVPIAAVNENLRLVLT